MPTWIVVEDEMDIHDFIMGMFEIWGINGLAFENGTDAISWLDKSGHQSDPADIPALALVDIRLPDIPGFEVSARMREQWGNNITIVLTTAYHMGPREEEQVMNWSQADALLYKPLPALDDLRRTIDRIIAQRQASVVACVTEVCDPTDDS